MRALLVLILLGLALPGPAPLYAADRRTPVVLAVERAVPSVVSIDVEVPVQSPFARAFGVYEATSQGSGVIIDADGVVLTNAHVVDGATKITAHTSDGRSFPAKIVGLDADLDLAVLRLDGAKDLRAVPRGRSADLLLGETVIAIGNPLGLGMTVSTGVVSSRSRELEIRTGSYQDYIQTDAAINPGNSGGALVNLNGELIGINTAVRADAQGIGFAIPADRALKVAQDFLSFGEVRAPWLGVDVRDVSRQKLAGTALAQGAVVVARVYPESPAARADLQGGDLIWMVGGHRVRSVADLNTQLAQASPGSRVPVSLYRGTSPLKLELSSGELPPEVTARVLSEVLGVQVQAGGGGLVVSTATAAGSWARAGLRTGDVILAVNGMPVDSAESLQQALRRAKAQHRATALFTVARGRYIGNISLDI